MRNRFLSFAILLLTLAASLAASDKKTDQKPTDQKSLQPQTRVWILRALTAEFALLKKALPRGQEGLHLNRDGKVDERSLEVQIANHGQAVRPGEVAQITKVNFHHDKIVLEVNGGGRVKKKWYQNVQIGMGSGTQTVTNQQDQVATGSQIAIDFGGPVPDLTVDQLKEQLSDVLDFSQRSASLILTDTWPKEIQEAVKNHTITAGMTREMVLVSRGRPDNKIREKTKKGADQETWVYGKVPSKILLVTFENDEVVEAHEYTPGVAATRVPRMDDPPAEIPPQVKPPQ